MSERRTITLDWAWLKAQVSEAVFTFFLPWRSYPKMRRLARDAMRSKGVDFGSLTHAERDELLKRKFGI